MKRNKIFMLIAALTLTLALAGCGEAQIPANEKSPKKYCYFDSDVLY